MIQQLCRYIDTRTVDRIKFRERMLDIDKQLSVMMHSTVSTMNLYQAGRMSFGC
jgi:hypothetical protein